MSSKQFYAGPMCPCAAANASGDGKTPEELAHDQQMGAFYYACSILLIYASLILYFMLKQVWKEEQMSKDGPTIRAAWTKLFAKGSPEEEQRLKGNLKKQLCVHLIKMGQMGFYVSASQNLTAQDASENEQMDEDDTPPSSPHLVDLSSTPILPVPKMPHSPSVKQLRSRRIIRRGLNRIATMDQGTEMEEFLNISVPRWPKRSVSLDQPDTDCSEGEEMGEGDDFASQYRHGSTASFPAEFGPKVEELLYFAPGQRRPNFRLSRTLTRQGATSSRSSVAESVSPLETTTHCFPASPTAQGDDGAQWI